MTLVGPEDQCPICGSTVNCLAVVADENLVEWFFECPDCEAELRMVIV